VGALFKLPIIEAQRSKTLSVTEFAMRPVELTPLLANSLIKKQLFGRKQLFGACT